MSSAACPYDYGHHQDNEPMDYFLEKIEPLAQDIKALVAANELKAKCCALTSRCENPTVRHSRYLMYSSQIACNFVLNSCAIFIAI